MTIALINGPNMNLLGKREVEIYGKISLGEIISGIRDRYADDNSVRILDFQSNIEGEIVNFIHAHMDEIDGVVINPAGLSLTGYSILDALNALPIPFVEVHVSNIFARGGWHAKSIFSADAVGMMTGFQSRVYSYGVESMIDYLNKK